jgi:hypothetical protein
MWFTLDTMGGSRAHFSEAKATKRQKDMLVPYTAAPLTEVGTYRWTIRRICVAFGEVSISALNEKRRTPRCPTLPSTPSPPATIFMFFYNTFPFLLQCETNSVSFSHSSLSKTLYLMGKIFQWPFE